jgi:hypothetical protein
MSDHKDSTNIDDLPNAASQENANMNMYVSEKNTDYNPSYDTEKPPTIDNKSVNDILSQTNHVAMSGALELPMRDVPRNAHNINLDEQVNTEYMHDRHRADYIQNWEDNQQIMYDQQRSDIQLDNMEVVYEQFQLPILIMMIYFFFHLPVVNKWFHRTFTFCFMKDGNMNFQGYVLKSFLFALLFYVLNKNINYIARM